MWLVKRRVKIQNYKVMEIMRQTHAYIYTQRERTQFSLLETPAKGLLVGYKIYTLVKSGGRTISGRRWISKEKNEGGKESTQMTMECNYGFYGNVTMKATH